MGCNWGWVAIAECEQVPSYADGGHPIWHKPPHERSRCETVKESMPGQVGHGLDMSEGEKKCLRRVGLVSQVSLSATAARARFLRSVK